MNDQEYLDILFGVRPADRRSLANGRVSARLKRRLPEWRGSGWAVASGLFLLVSMFWIASRVADPEVYVNLPLTLFYFTFLWFLPVVMLCSRALDLLNERRVLRRGPRVRVIEGTVQTERTRVPVKTKWLDRDTGDWVETSEGDRVEVLFHLTGMPGQTTPTTLVIPKLEDHLISGWARIFLVTVPTRESYSPSYKTVVAVEVGPDTSVSSAASELAEDSGDNLRR